MLVPINAFMWNYQYQSSALIRFICIMSIWFRVDSVFSCLAGRRALDIPQNLEGSAAGQKRHVLATIQPPLPSSASRTDEDYEQYQKYIKFIDLQNQGYRGSPLSSQQAPSALSLSSTGIADTSNLKSSSKTKEDMLGEFQPLATLKDSSASNEVEQFNQLKEFQQFQQWQEEQQKKKQLQEQFQQFLEFQAFQKQQVQQQSNPSKRPPIYRDAPILYPESASSLSERTPPDYPVTSLASGKEAGAVAGATTSPALTSPMTGSTTNFMGGASSGELALVMRDTERIPA